MPSTYAHYVFGRNIIKRYSDDIAEIVKPNRELFQIGLHGPDILFYYKPLSPNEINQIGYSTHSRPARELFENAAEVINNEKNEIVRQRKLAYALGLICHFALDSECHGYIEKKIHADGISHTEIEVEFDRYLMLKDGKNPITQHLTGHIHPRMKNAEAIAPFYKGANADNVLTALESMISYNDLLIAPREGKRLLVYAILKASGNYDEMHGLIVNRNPEPKCADSNIRLEKLSKKALEKCLKLTDNFMAFADGRENLNKEFDKTFSFDENWQNIEIHSAEEELRMI